MKRTYFCLLFLVLSLMVQNAAAQEKPDLLKRIEKVFAAKEPMWKLQPYGQSMPPTIYLKSATGHALIYVSEADSEDLVHQQFEGSTIAEENMSASRHLKKTVVPNFGDENFMFIGRAETIFHFRQANVFITIHSTAPPAVVKRFADYVMSELKKEISHGIF